MKRHQIYSQIVNLNLQNKVKEKYGINYTNCRNAELLEVIEAEKKIKTKKGFVLRKCEPELNKRFNTLINILKERHLLLDSDVAKLMN